MNFSIGSKTDVQGKTVFNKYLSDLVFVLFYLVSCLCYLNACLSFSFYLFFFFLFTFLSIFLRFSFLRFSLMIFHNPCVAVMPSFTHSLNLSLTLSVCIVLCHLHAMIREHVSPFGICITIMLQNIRNHCECECFCSDSMHMHNVSSSPLNVCVCYRFTWRKKNGSSVQCTQTAHANT